MQNLMLDLEALAVETFATSPDVQSSTAGDADLSISKAIVCDTGCC